MSRNTQGPGTVFAWLCKYLRQPLAPTLALLLLPLFLWASRGQAASAKWVGGNIAQGEPILLNRRLAYLHDPTGRLAVDHLAGAELAGRFVPLSSGRSRFGFSPGTHWFRLNPDLLPLNQGFRILEAGTPSLDRVRVYIPHGDEGWEVFRAGDLYPYVDRPLASRRLAFPLPAELPAGKAIFIAASSAGPVRMPVRLWRERDFFAAESRDDIWLALFSGVFVAMILYNLVIFVSVGDPTYLAYVGFWTAFLGLQLSYRGAGQALFWPEAAGLSNPITLAFLGAVVAGGSRFAQTFFAIPGKKPRAAPLLRTWFWAGLAAVALAGILPYGLLLQGLLVLAGAMIASAAWIAAQAWREGYRPARFFAAALATLTPGLALNLAVGGGLVAETESVARLIQLSTMAEPFVFALSLADRISLMGQQLSQAEQGMLRLRERFGIDLLQQQERSRKTIAGNLHDSVGQGLLVLMNHLKRLRRGGKAPTDKALDEMVGIAQETMDEVRAICHDLHPHQLERLGLDQALRSMLRGLFEGSGIVPILDLVPIPGYLGVDTEIHLFRLAQEAANNVLKHSAAAHCWVTLAAGGGKLHLTVRDDGCGLPQTEEAGDGPPFGGFGMTTMRERARALGGHLSLNSAPGEGLTLAVTLPMPLED